MTELAIGKNLDDAIMITEEDIVKALDGFARIQDTLLRPRSGRVAKGDHRLFSKICF
jgi:NifU-like protein involved in Fe-S cluster formation